MPNRRSTTSVEHFSRRSLLSLGCFGLTSLGLSNALRASIKQDVLERAKSVLILYMDGGPSHLDMFDVKPGAPAEIRGPVSSIESSVPGISVGEYLPKVARQMHHVAQIRSMQH